MNNTARKWTLFSTMLVLFAIEVLLLLIVLSPSFVNDLKLKQQIYSNSTRANASPDSTANHEIAQRRARALEMQLRLVITLLLIGNTLLLTKLFRVRKRLTGIGVTL